MSWIIVEKQLFLLWKRFLKEKKLSSGRRNKLLNPSRWSADYVLETLSLNGILSTEQYRSLDKLRRERNRFIHRGGVVSEDVAEQCVSFGFRIVRNTMEPSVDAF